MPKLIDLTGRRFGELKVIARAKDRCNRSRWHCVCNCGNSVDVFSQGLLKGTTKNCGSIETHISGRGGAHNVKHGLAHTRLYKMYMGAKERAKLQGIPFTLKLSDMPAMPEHCPVFGFRLQIGESKGTHDKSPSLDKIRPEKGYVPGNIQIISGKANKMKSNATTEEIGKLYSYMLGVEKEIIA